MDTTFSTWGNSLAIRIPKAIAEAFDLFPNSHAKIKIKDGAIVIIPQRDEKDAYQQLSDIAQSGYSLQELLEGETALPRKTKPHDVELLGDEVWEYKE